MKSAPFTHRALLLAFAFAGSCGCGNVQSTESVGGDTNTNWLKACDVDAECGTTYSCMCGRCTIRCSADRDCSGHHEEAICKAAGTQCEGTRRSCQPLRVSSSVDAGGNAATDGGPPVIDASNDEPPPFGAEEDGAAPTATEPDTGSANSGAPLDLSARGIREWTVPFEQDTNQAHAVVVDGAGGVAIAGQLQAAGDDAPDAFVASYSTESGELLWSNVFGTNGRDWANDVTADGDGNLFIAGATEGALNETTDGSGEGGDAFLVKLASDGETLWTRLVNGTENFDVASGVGMAADGSVLVCGAFGSSADSFSRAFVAKYSTTGEQLWLQTLGAAEDGNTTAASVAAHPAGDAVTVVGSTRENLEGDAIGLNDAFVAQFTGGGDLVWVRQFGTDEGDDAEAVSVDADGNAFVVGQSYGGIDGAPQGGGDAFIAKYTEAGDPVWLRAVATPAEDVGTDVTVDRGGWAFIVGGTAGELGEADLDQTDVFVAQYSPAGERLWTQQFGSDGQDYGYGIAADDGGHLFVTGSTRGGAGSPSAGETWSFLTRFR